MTIEENFIRLDEIVKKMEAGQITLEDSFALYKEGMELVKKCSDSIEKVEHKIKVLNKEGGLDEF
ncbi:hypothetical protein P261_00480 [Lachnospiraceae bacterium TWA4]|nr:hypothetical protein P261_00480 [Lachnospiraceae bacterium TWA4]